MATVPLNHIRNAQYGMVIKMETTFDVSTALEELALKRKEAETFEKEHAALYGRIKWLEAEIKKTVAATNIEADGGGLRCSFVKGRVSYDGPMLYDVCKKVENELLVVAKVVSMNPDVYEPISAYISGSLKFIQYALEDGEKTGEKTLKISAAKSAKTQE